MKRSVVLAALFIASCAKIVTPSGGPVDDVSPEVISVYPEPGFVEETPLKITIVFSEKIRNAEENVQVYPDRGWEVESRGSEISLNGNSGGGLVTVTLSGGLEDLRGNGMETPVTFVWNSIPADSFADVTAKIFRDGGGGITSNARCDFFLYPDSTIPLITHFPDTLGIVNAGWLSPGDYTVVCYEDQDRSRKWDPEGEPGVSEHISLVPGGHADLSMTMTIVDSIGPRISELLVVDSYHLELLWNEQLSTVAGEGQNITLTGPSGEPVTVYGIKSSSGRSLTGRLTVYSAELSDTSYTIAVEGVTDLAGNPSTPDTLEFWGTDSLPAAKLAVQSAYPDDGSVDIPPAGPFYISFTDWVDKDSAEFLYTVTRVADSTVVAGDFVRTSATAFSFTPFNELLGERQYRVDFGFGLVSLQGDTVSGESWTFIPAWSEQPGSISGVITGTGATQVTMVVSPAGSGGSVLSGSFTPGNYSFSEIPGGRYTVSVFVDWNSNGTWDPGEPYGAWPGVVEVFPGIDTGDIAVQVVP